MRCALTAFYSATLTGNAGRVVVRTLAESLWIGRRKHIRSGPRFGTGRLFPFASPKSTFPNIEISVLPRFVTPKDLVPDVPAQLYRVPSKLRLFRSR